MKITDKKQIDLALKKTGLVGKIVGDCVSMIALIALSIFLFSHYGTFLSYSFAAFSAITACIAGYNAVNNYTNICRIQAGNFRYLKSKILLIQSCSGIIPGKQDYMQVQTADGDFFINKLYNDNFQSGDEIEAVFLSNNNVPISITKIESTEKMEDTPEQNTSAENGGFATPMIVVWLALGLIAVLLLVTHWL
jgi:hypothetical protein